MIRILDALGAELSVDFSLLTASSVMFDAVGLGGELQINKDSKEWSAPAGDGIVLGSALNTSDVSDNFIAAIAEHRHWSRERV